MKLELQQLNGDLFWYQHRSWHAEGGPSERNYDEWVGPRKLRSGLTGVTMIFANPEETGTWNGPN